MLWGEEDTALGIETTYGTEQYVADLTLRYLPGVSHWVQQEAPETVNAMLEAWLLGKPVPQRLGARLVAKILVYGPRLNPFVDKVLRGLALKKLEHRPRRAAEPRGLPEAGTPRRACCPVADLAGQRVADSHKILDVLDERWPEPPLTAADPKLAAAQRNLEQWASETFLFYWEHYLRQRMQEVEDGAPERAAGRAGALRHPAAAQRPGGGEPPLRGGVRPADRRPRQLPRRAPVLLRRPHQPRRSRGLLVPAPPDARLRARVERRGHRPSRPRRLAGPRGRGDAGRRRLAGRRPLRRRRGRFGRPRAPFRDAPHKVPPAAQLRGGRRRCAPRCTGAARPRPRARGSRSERPCPGAGSRGAGSR